MTAAEELLAILRQRRSIRRFTAQPVPTATIMRLIELGAWAPSAGNRQDWFFTAVTSTDLKARMGRSVRQRWQAILDAYRDHLVAEELAQYAGNFDAFISAPTVIAVSARKVSAVQEELMGAMAALAGGSILSAAMAAENLMLAAHALGLGSCCMTGAIVAREELAELLQLGRRHELVCLVTLGYPAEQPAAPERKGVAQIARFLE